MIKIERNVLAITFGELNEGDIFSEKDDTEEFKLFMKTEVNGLKNAVLLSNGTLTWFANSDKVIPVDATLTYKYRGARTLNLNNKVISMWDWKKNTMKEIIAWKYIEPFEGNK